MDLAQLLKDFGFPVAVAAYLLWENRRSRDECREDNKRLHSEIESLKTQHFQIQKDIATTLRETNRLVKRIFRIVDEGGDPLPHDDRRSENASDTMLSPLYDADTERIANR